MSKTKISAGITQALPGDFLTCKETGELLKVHEISVRRLLTQKKLKRYKFGARTLIRKSEVLALVREV
jgi:excisionase family DNA binding protein